MSGSRLSITSAANRIFSTAVQSYKPSSLWQHPRTIPLVCRGNLMRFPTLCAVKSRVFHTTSRNDIPPVVLLAKLASIIGGRTFRKWWQVLTPEKKLYYKNRFLKNKKTIGAVVGVLTAASVVHYYTHLQLTPLTNRRRYIALTPEQFLKIYQTECDLLLEQLKDNIIPPSNPVYEQIVDVVQRIVNSNQDLEFFRHQVWTIAVINSNEANAAVLPTGHILVFNGILNVTQTKNHLAVVLGHEMAHALLGHGAERLSFATVLDVIVIVVLGAIWAFIPADGIAIITHWFYHKVMQLMLHLPYSRKLELEADEVGLQLIAKACYDIRESTVFWLLMGAEDEVSSKAKRPQWSSTHPANETRTEKFDELIPKAIKQRESCNCRALPDKDPRDRIPEMRQVIEKMKAELAAAAILPTVRPPTAATEEANT